MAVLVQPGEVKVLRGTYSSIAQFPARWSHAHVPDTRRRDKGLQQQTLRLAIGRNHSSMMLVKHWKLFPRQCVLCVSRNAIKMCMDKALSTLVKTPPGVPSSLSNAACPSSSCFQSAENSQILPDPRRNSQEAQSFSTGAPKQP